MPIITYVHVLPVLSTQSLHRSPRARKAGGSVTTNANLSENLFGAFMRLSICPAAMPPYYTLQAIVVELAFWGALWGKTGLFSGSHACMQLH